MTKINGIELRSVDARTVSVTRAKKMLGISYIGAVAMSTKLEKSLKRGYATYGVYLAPADMSGHNTCPMSEHCKAFCLVNSGRVVMDILSGHNRINAARVKRTLLFYENRPLFLKIMRAEIRRAKRWADKRGLPTSGRLNCTSDLSPNLFADFTGSILDEFSDIQFYDYTKVYSRVKEQHRRNRPNYDLTFSHDGYNWDTCKQVLMDGGRVAVVFYGGMPKEFDGYDVISGDNYDMRFLDPKGVVVGLTYHKTANDYKVVNGKRVFIEPNTPFVVKASDPRCVF